MLKKICPNPKCFKPEFETNNPNKNFCCTRCKNQAHYMWKNDFYEWEITKQRMRAQNIKILEHLYNNKFLVNLEETLEKFGFDFSAAYLHYLDEAGNKIYRFGNHGLMQIEENENPKKNKYKIITFKNKKS